jgi:hypothetical protein
MGDINFDDLLDVLLEDTAVQEQHDMVIENELNVQQTKPLFKFNCIEDNETYYPDVVCRRRYGGYKPHKPPKVKFINPFEKQKIEPVYSKQLHDSMDRIRLRENDKRDSKIKYIKKKFQN